MSRVPPIKMNNSSKSITRSMSQMEKIKEMNLGSIIASTSLKRINSGSESKVVLQN